MNNNISTLGFENNGRRIVPGGGDIHKIKYTTIYEDFISKENIFKAFYNFKKGKQNKEDVNMFGVKLSDNLLDLHYELKNKSYKHQGYSEFVKHDIKKRLIHKATVRDRVVHHLIYDNLYGYFDRYFLYDSYSCRINKGVHRAIFRYEYFARKICKNYTKQVFVLKFDIKKCFASINQDILLNILSDKIKDKQVIDLLKLVIESFDKGLPLGNLTSQLFINIYLHELDFYCKHILKIRYYIRYADDVICMFENNGEAENMVLEISNFLKEILKLEVHKIQIKTLYSGMDFLGWIHFPKYRILRKITKMRIFRNINEKNLSSYEGLFTYGNTHKLKNVLFQNMLKVAAH